MVITTFIDLIRTTVVYRLACMKKSGNRLFRCPDFVIHYNAVKNSLPVIVKNASGVTFKEVSGSVLKSIEVMLPAFSVADSFTKMVDEIFSRQEKLELENQQLIELRDWILPLLMNGQVSIK